MNRNQIYLCTPINALVEGIYEQQIPFSQIKEHGDFTISTFNNLDGKMVILDGEIYQILSTGKVNRISDNALTPFACVKFYQPHSHDELTKELDYQNFLKWMRGLLPSPNIFYAIRIEGHFSSVKTHSVPRQENYRSLVEVANEQPVFSFSDIEGTLAGFYTPSFMGSVSAPMDLDYLTWDFQRDIEQDLNKAEK